MKIGLLASPFNPIQPGHLWAIKQALQAGVCDGVLAAVNAAPNHNRPEKRPPIWKTGQRMEMVKKTPGVVGAIAYWSERDLYRLIEIERPAVLIVGKDHLQDQVTGGDLGIPIFWAERHPDWSSTQFVNAIYEHERQRREAEDRCRVQDAEKALLDAVSAWSAAKCPCAFPEWDGTQTGGTDGTMAEFGGSIAGSALLSLMRTRDAEQASQGVPEAGDQEDDRELQVRRMRGMR